MNNHSIAPTSAAISMTSNATNANQMFQLPAHMIPQNLMVERQAESCPERREQRKAVEPRGGVPKQSWSPNSTMAIGLVNSTAMIKYDIIMATDVL